MVTSVEEVKQYIQQYQNQYTKDAIIAELKQTGVDQSLIDQAYAQIEGTTSQQPASQTSQEQASSNQTGQNGKVKKRNPVLVLLFSIITLGIYMVVWIVLTSIELKQNSSKMLNPLWLLFVLVPIIGQIFGLYYLWKYYEVLHELTGANKIMLFIFQLVPILNLVGLYMTQQELNKLAA